jgi:hypothetical protein
MNELEQQIKHLVRDIEKNQREFLYYNELRHKKMQSKFFLVSSTIVGFFSGFFIGHQATQEKVKRLAYRLTSLFGNAYANVKFLLPLISRL